MRGGPRDRAAYNAYMAAYMAVRYEQRKAEGIALLGSKCSKCGSTEDLQFDHKDPSSKWATIAKIWGLAKKRFLEELSKCQLLCRECHHEKTCSDMGWTFRPKSERRSGWRAKKKLRDAGVSGNMSPL